jgi:hypothetical protein
MKKLMIVAILVLTGCTGTEVRVTPEVSNNIYNQPYETLGVRPVTADKTIKEVGDMNNDFATSLRTSGIAKEIYYPLRLADNPEVTLDTKFESSLDTHGGALAFKAFFTGLLMFLPEPFFWYDFDYSLTGEVSIFKGKTLVNRISKKQMHLLV